MNPGCFIKGEKRVNQGKRGLGKVTVKTREAIQAFTDTNAHKLQMWLDEIHQKDGPKAAFECYTRLTRCPALVNHFTVGRADGKGHK